MASHWETRSHLSLTCTSQTSLLKMWASTCASRLSEQGWKRIGSRWISQVGLGLCLNSQGDVKWISQGDLWTVSAHWNHSRKKKTANSGYFHLHMSVSDLAMSSTECSLSQVEVNYNSFVLRKSLRVQLGKNSFRGTMSSLLPILPTALIWKYLILCARNSEIWTR